MAEHRVVDPAVVDPAVVAAHDAAVAAGQPGYLDPHSGLFVMTAQYHRERGRCCGSGCRHCPYPDVTGDAS